MGFAKTFMVGRTTREIELRYTANKKTAVATFDLAVDLGFGNRKSSNYFRMKAFGQTAENLNKYVRKGVKLEIECEAHVESYENKEGKRVYNTVFYVQKFEFAESRAAQQESNHAKKETGVEDSTPVQIDQPWMSVPDGIEGELPFL